MRPTSQQRQSIKHRINCMGWCARSSTFLTHTSPSPVLGRGIFSTQSHTCSSGRMEFSWRMQQWILNAINMLPVTLHENLLCCNSEEMLNQLPWFTKLYCFLNEQQYITVFSLVLGTLIMYPIKSEHRLLVGAWSDSYMQFSDSKTHCRNAFAVSADM